MYNTFMHTINVHHTHFINVHHTHLSMYIILTLLCTNVISPYYIGPLPVTVTVFMLINLLSIVYKVKVKSKLNIMNVYTLFLCIVRSQNFVHF